MKKTDPLLLASGLVLLTALSCDRDHVQSTRIEKSTPAPLPPVQAPAPAERAQALQWILPKGWTTGQAGGMRYATLLPSAAGKVEVSVVMLTGSAGGELANVNRWREQLGLPPIEEADLVRKVVESKAGSVAVFEFANANNRMVVGLLATPEGDTWFLKLMGEDAPVRQARPAFLNLLGTLTLG